MGIFSSLFSKKVNKIQEALSLGASILDVRSASEFRSGHCKGSVNIPLNNVAENIGKIKKMQKPLLVCCASGMRSASAVSILKSKGVEQVMNAGGWTKIDRYL